MTVAASDPAASGIQTSLDGGPFTDSSSVAVSGDGSHTIDARGSDGTEARTVVLVDATPPDAAITVPATIAQDAALKLAFACTDRGSGVATCVALQDGVARANGDLLDTSQGGTSTITVETTDNAGNRNIVTATLTVVANRPPTAPGAPALAAGSSTPNKGAFTLRWQASTDPDGDPITYTVLHSSGGAYTQVGTSTTPTFAFTSAPEAVGTWTYEIAASDAKHSVLSAASPAIVVDRTPPVLTLPASVTADALTSAGAPVSFTATARDAVDGVVAATCAPASGSTFVLGDTVVRCQATDRAGNAASGSFTVHVRGYREQISVLQAKIAAAVATASPPVSSHLKNAADRLGDANNAAFWVDALRLQPPRGGLVYVDLELAADFLRLAHGGAVPNATLDAWASTAAHIADELARTAVADAVAAHGTAAKITGAQTALASAQTALTAANYYGAIVYDAAAWVLAEQAVKKLP